MSFGKIPTVGSLIMAVSEFLGLAISGLQQIKNCHYSKTATTPWCSILLVLTSSKYSRVSNKRTIAVSIPMVILLRGDATETSRVTDCLLRSFSNLKVLSSL